MTDQYPGALERTLRDIERRLQRLEASQKAGRGLNIGQASGAFLLPNSPTPGTPQGGAYLYSSGGQVRWRDSSGVDHALPGSASTAPTWPGSFTSPATISSAPTAAHYNALRSDCADILHASLRSVILVGREAGVWPG